MSARHQSSTGRPIEIDCWMGTFNVAKGRGHVRLPDDTTATIDEKVFYAAGSEGPCAEHTLMRVTVVDHGTHKEVTQVLTICDAEASKVPLRLELVEQDRGWTDACYATFIHQRRLGFCRVGTDLVVVLSETLERANLQDAHKGERFQVRCGKTEQGTRVVAEIRRPV